MFKTQQLVLLAGLILLCLLSGCGSMERITESEESAVSLAIETAPDTAQDTAVPDTSDEADAAPVSDSSEVYSLTVDGPVGVCEYRVDSWSLYDSWEAAGISEDQLCSSYPVGEGGVMLVKITQYCERINEETASLGDDMNVNVFQPIAQSQIDGARASDDFQRYLDIGTEPRFDPSYLDKTGLTGDYSDGAYFHYPMLSEGESTTYTLGFVLSGTTRAAAEDGTLFLQYTTNGVPASIDDLILLPVK